MRQVVHPAPTQATPQTLADNCGKPAGGKYIGVSVPRSSLIAQTEQQTGTTTNVDTLYYSVGAAIDQQNLVDLCEANKLPIIDMVSNNESLAKIASGSEDSYFTNLAQMLGASQVPVGFDFDHEFNGGWYKWGYKNVTPEQFIAAWRHIVTLFRSYGADNVIWIWNPNVSMGEVTNNLQAWYPGDSYVNWVGLDGYFYSSDETYATVFDYTINQVRKFTKHPLIIVETGANPPSGPARAIKSLFEGVPKTPGMLGLIYFDYDKTPVHNWYINNDPSALAAFKAGAAAYLKAAG